MTGTLDGRIALVTGAGRMSGTGHSIALALAAQGCHLALHGSGSDPSRWPQSERDAGWRGLDSVADEVRALGRNAHIVTGDLRSSAEVDAMIDATVEGLGGLDILVNNAAAPAGDDRVPVVDMTDEAWKLVLDVKLDGAFYASRAAARRMRTQGRGGRIINISSMAGKVANPNMSAYNVANAGIQMLGASMARELGRDAITVNTLCVGVVDTSRVAHMTFGPEYIQRTIPLGRIGSPDEIGGVVAFLASDAAAYITGQSINVDGGVAVH